MKQKLEKPYTVEQKELGCQNCGEGAMWRVIDPDGIELDTSYSSLENAKELVWELNRAFFLGKKEMYNKRYKQIVPNKRRKQWK